MDSSRSSGNTRKILELTDLYLLPIYKIKVQKVLTSFLFVHHRYLLPVRHGDEPLAVPVQDYVGTKFTYNAA